MVTKLLTNLLMVTVSIVVTFVAAELMFRAALFSRVPYLESYRNATLYADYDSDNYWKLYSMFGKYNPPKPHPLLGWVGNFDRDSYTHHEIAKLGNKRPVLLYGDSFAACVVGPEECFQGILNSDRRFSQDYFLLNYGVLGYGVDQIFLLYQKTIGQYKNPYVILSLLTEDLDRSVVSLRIGHKPIYRLINDQLVLSGVPIDSSFDSFLSNHPPEIRSYLFQMYVRNTWPPWRLKNYFRAAALSEKQEKIEEINRRILFEIIRDLRKRQLDHVFLIFHPKGALAANNDWRDAFLVNLFDSNKAPYLTSKPILQREAEQSRAKYDDYYIAGDGHLKARGNRIIAEAIRNHILAGAPHWGTTKQ